MRFRGVGGHGRMDTSGHSCTAGRNTERTSRTATVLSSSWCGGWRTAAFAMRNAPGCGVASLAAPKGAWFENRAAFRKRGHRGAHCGGGSGRKPEEHGFDLATPAYAMAFRPITSRGPSLHPCRVQAPSPRGLSSPAQVRPVPSPRPPVRPLHLCSAPRAASRRSLRARRCARR